MVECRYGTKLTERWAFQGEDVDIEFSHGQLVNEWNPIEYSMA
jgi:hypothetical protein